jgi:processive 1,2-diacylglycerol beta-glucosyltransferase
VPRMLILHATVGSGHRSAAYALEAACRRMAMEAVLVKDAFDYALPLLRTAYVEPYLQLTARAPELFGAFYKFTDKETSVIDQLRQTIDRFGSDRLRQLLAESIPDIIICTHYLPLGVLSRLKERGQLPQPLFCVLTDYAAHTQWIYPAVDGYFVASEGVRDQLIERGVAASQIVVSGIPVNPAIADPKDAAEVRLRHGFARDAPLITFFGSGMETRQAVEVVDRLVRAPVAGRLLVVAGRSPDLADALVGIQGNAALRLDIYGTIDYVDDLVAASDLVISKAGGLIVAEVLARGTPLLITAPVPGHEQHNADYVVAHGAGLHISVAANVADAVVALVANPARLAQLRDCASAAGRPAAAMNIVRSAAASVHY